ncbi:MAG: hypothetical protein ACYCYP_07530 [Leptospirales bacterium]
MGIMRTFMPVLWVLVLLPSLYGCASSPPHWVNHVPQETGFALAVGVGQSQDPFQAIENARQDALGQIVSSWFGERLDIRYQSNRSQVKESEERDIHSYLDSVSKGKLAGQKILRNWVTRINGQVVAYVLLGVKKTVLAQSVRDFQTSEKALEKVRLKEQETQAALILEQSKKEAQKIQKEAERKAREIEQKALNESRRKKKESEAEAIVTQAKEEAVRIKLEAKKKAIQIEKGNGATNLPKMDDPPPGSDEVSPTILLESPAQFSHVRVHVSGRVRGIQNRVSHRGHSYTLFNLCDPRSCIRVFSWGFSQVREEESIAVWGTFYPVKSVGRYLFHNELVTDASN